MGGQSAIRHPPLTRRLGTLHTCICTAAPPGKPEIRLESIPSHPLNHHKSRRCDPGQSFDAPGVSTVLLTTKAIPRQDRRGSLPPCWLQQDDWLCMFRRQTRALGTGNSLTPRLIRTREHRHKHRHAHTSGRAETQRLSTSDQPPSCPTSEPRDSEPQSTAINVLLHVQLQLSCTRLTAWPLD